MYRIFVCFCAFVTFNKQYSTLPKFWNTASWNTT